MENKKDYIYIFLHIPKTGGTTLVKHALKNFKKDEILEITPKVLGLNEIFNKKIYDKRIEIYLKNIKEIQLDKIKFIYGHVIPYGIHKYFKREPRYITFIRNPIRRIPSIYNYFYTLYEKKMDKKLAKRLSHVFLINGKVPEFKSWYEEKFKSKEKDIAFMNTFRFLTELGYLKKNDKTIPQILKGLQKFYFIGITENFKQDSLFLYYKLNINKYFLSENVSKKHIDPQKNKEMSIKISKDNPISMMVFNAAIKINNDFINKYPEYLKIIKKQNIKRMFLLTITQSFFEPGGFLQIFRK